MKWIANAENLSSPCPPEISFSVTKTEFQHEFVTEAGERAYSARSDADIDTQSIRSRVSSSSTSSLRISA